MTSAASRDQPRLFNENPECRLARQIPVSQAPRVLDGAAWSDRTLSASLKQKLEAGVTRGQPALLDVKPATSAQSTTWELSESPVKERA